MRIWIVFLHKVETDSEVETERSKKVVEALHKILRPFLLRKVKTNVEKNLLPSTFSFSVPILGGH
jgi:SWI/SNF-related matrix-associated actin-dependent regulator of chromatin subfamily A member 5